MHPDVVFVTAPSIRHCQFLGFSLSRKQYQYFGDCTHRLSAPTRFLTTALTPSRPDPLHKKRRLRDKPLKQWQKHIDRDQNADNRGVGFWPMGSEDRLFKEAQFRETFTEAYNRRILAHRKKPLINTVLEGDGPLDHLILTLRARYMERMHTEDIKKKQTPLTHVESTLYNTAVDEIRRCDELYYADDPKPLVRDQDYDELVMHVLELERLYPELITSDSPSQTVGHSAARRSAQLYEAMEQTGESMRAQEMLWRAKATTTSRPFKQLKHPIPMLSLSNAYNQRDLISFGKKVEECSSKVCIEMKIDGVALSLHYKNRKLKKAVTRGNGRIGDDVTSNIRAGLIGRGVVDVLPDSTPDDFLVVRGEVFISPDDFQGLLIDAETNLSNARNAAAGAIKHKDAREVRKRRVQFIAYECMKQDEEGEFSPMWETQSETLAGLPTWGFGAMAKFSVVDSVDEAQLFAAQMEELRDELPFETDGVVLKVDNSEKRQALGHTAKSPRGAIALKFTARSVVTTVSSVRMQVSRTGSITPVAELVPTSIAGATIRRATLHNFDEVKRLGVAVGDAVVLERGGDVIPKITRVATPAERRVPIVVPTACPCCGASVKVSKNDAGNTEVSCSEPVACAGQNLGRLIHFVSRDAMEITGMGSKTISKLLDSGLIVRLADIFKLTVEDLISLDGIKEKTANSLYAAIQDAGSNRTLERLIIALGVPGIGRTSARALALKAVNLDGLRELTSARNPLLLSMPNVAEKSAERIAEYLGTTRIQAEIMELNRQIVLKGVVDEPDSSDVDETKDVSVGSIQISGKRFAFTGTLNCMPRQEALKRIKEAGGKVGDLTKKTDYLICGVDPGFKYNKAQRFGVKILFEEDLAELFAERSTEIREEDVVVEEEEAQEKEKEGTRVSKIEVGDNEEEVDEGEGEKMTNLVTAEEIKIIEKSVGQHEIGEGVKNLEKKRYGPNYDPETQCLVYEMSLAEMLHIDNRELRNKEKEMEMRERFVQIDKEATEEGWKAVKKASKGFAKKAKEAKEAKEAVIKKRQNKNVKKKYKKYEVPWTDMNSMIEFMMEGEEKGEEVDENSLPSEEELDTMLEEALSDPDNVEFLLNLQRANPVTDKKPRRGRTRISELNEDFDPDYYYDHRPYVQSQTKDE